MLLWTGLDQQDRIGLGSDGSRRNGARAEENSRPGGVADVTLCMIPTSFLAGFDYRASPIKADSPAGCNPGPICGKRVS